MLRKQPCDYIEMCLCIIQYLLISVSEAHIHGFVCASVITNCISHSTMLLLFRNNRSSARFRMKQTLELQ